MDASENSSVEVASHPSENEDLDIEQSKPEDLTNSDSGNLEPRKKRKRTARTFPTCSFEEALDFAQAIQKFGSGKPIRRITLFNELGKAPESGWSRQLISNANKYGLVKGNSASEFLELTSEGNLASADEIPARDCIKARATLAILSIPPFKALYDIYVGNKLPSRSVLADAIRQQDLVSEEYINEAIDTFLVNVKFVGLLKTLSGVERLITIEHLLEEFPVSQYALPKPIFNSMPTNGDQSEQITKPTTQSTKGNPLDLVCFYITPIGEEDSETRLHADLFLGSLVEPALEELGFTVVRADHIDKPGIITRQILDYLLHAKLVVADLSYHNPNVFYELAIRHTTRLPTVQIIRTSDTIPFDVNQNRTIKIDCSSIYTLVPKLELYRAQIANQVRMAIEEPDSVENPIVLHFPNFIAQPT